MCSVYAQDFTQRPNPHHLVEKSILDSVYAAMGIGYAPMYNAWIGNGETFLVTGDGVAKKMVFGLTPAWADKMMYLFNARSEGKLNPENDPNYRGEMGIFGMPAFRSAIKSRRAILPVHYFIEGPEKEKLKKPFKVFRSDKQVFFVACIWETWTDKQTGEMLDTFAMVTTAPSKHLRETVGHHRSPLILEGDEIQTWLDPASQKNDLVPLMKPFNSDAFACHPISQLFKSKENRPEYFEAVDC
jgi:putative SOS response-associated peptidase YedK